MRAESAATGRRSTRWFQGLSRGKTGQRGAPGRREACAAGAGARRVRTARSPTAGRSFTRALSAREAGDPRGGGGPPAREVSAPALGAVALDAGDECYLEEAHGPDSASAPGRGHGGEQ